MVLNDTEPIAGEDSLLTPPDKLRGGQDNDSSDVAPRNLNLQSL